MSWSTPFEYRSSELDEVLYVQIKDANRNCDAAESLEVMYPISIGSEAAVDGMMPACADASPSAAPFQALGSCLAHSAKPK
jgi:hypothetical protein